MNTIYMLHGQVLEAVTSAKYLGVDISNTLSWNSHIDRVVGIANRSLGFIRRNITSIPRNAMSHLLCAFTLGTQ